MVIHSVTVQTKINAEALASVKKCHTSTKPAPAGASGGRVGILENPAVTDSTSSHLLPCEDPGPVCLPLLL